MTKVTYLLKDGQWVYCHPNGQEIEIPSIGILEDIQDKGLGTRVTIEVDNGDQSIVPGPSDELQQVLFGFPVVHNDSVPSAQGIKIQRPQ